MYMYYFLQLPQLDSDLVTATSSSITNSPEGAVNAPPSIQEEDVDSDTPMLGYTNDVDNSVNSRIWHALLEC